MAPADPVVRSMRAMSLKIDADHGRFKDIVRGKIKQNLKKYIQKGEMIGKQGKDVISIPVPSIELPRFRFGHRDQGGVGQGEGDVGQVLKPGQVEEGEGGKKAGEGAGDHSIEVDVTMAELAQMLGEELKLPRIEPKGKERIENIKYRYTGINTQGPESLRHFKRTFKQALKRQIAQGTYNSGTPLVVPLKSDRRYRAWKEIIEPQANAVIIYMMDVSGSMGDEQKEIVRIESFWLDTWLRSQYKGIESRYIIHDAMAKEVDRETFFHTRESGGTMISSAYKLCWKLIEENYSPSEWNIYPFHFSDGDNWSADDSSQCISLLREHIIPAVNMFGYGQVESPYGSGQFIKDLREAFPGAAHPKVVTSEIKDKDAIYGSIKDFLHQGH
jgi:sporulation protein YhbH